VTKKILKNLPLGKSLKVSALTVVGLLSLSSLGRASAFGPTVSPDGSGGYIFDYSLAPNLGSTFETGDFFVIYDVPNIPLTSLSAPADWLPSEQLLGPDPSFGFPGADSATVENIVFTYIGTASISDTTPVSGFDIDSPWNAETFNWFGVQYNGAKGNSISLIAAPATPEPVSLGLAALGLGALALMGRRRRA